MPTNKETLLLQSELLSEIPDGVLEFHLTEQDLVSSDDYSAENRRGIDLALAGLILFISTRPTSVRELDYQITYAGMGDLMNLRRILLAKWGISDGTQPTIRAPRVW